MSDQGEGTKDDLPRENQAKKEEDQKLRNYEEESQACFKKMFRETSRTCAPLPIKVFVPTIPNPVNLLSEADEYCWGNSENKTEYQKPRIDGEDLQSPLKNICRESSLTSADDPLPIKGSVPPVPMAVHLRSEEDGDSLKNVENKIEDGKPRNDVANSWKPGNNSAIVIKNSVSTPEKQTPPRKEPEEDSYTRRLLCDVETQIGFFKGAIDYDEVNKKYPFVDSKSINEFIVKSLRAGASSTHVMNQVERLKSQQSDSMNSFIRDWLEVDDSVENVMEAVTLLKLQYKKRLYEIEGMLDRLDPDRDKTFDFAHKIWGRTEKPAIEDVKRSHSFPEAERLKRCHNDYDYDYDYARSTAVKKLNKNTSNCTLPLSNKLSILTKILDFKQDYGRYPYQSTVDLVEFNDNCVQFGISVQTLASHIKSFRDKYMEIRERQMFSFDSPEEASFYMLAHQIWGDE